MGVALRPTLVQYFFFNVKVKDKFDRRNIDEAEGLWESLCEIYHLHGSIKPLEESLYSLPPGKPLDFSFKYLGSMAKSDDTIKAEQLLFNDMLVFIFTLTSAPDFRTEQPELSWENQLEIIIASRDLDNILGVASALLTSSEQHEDILMTVRMKIPFAQAQTVNYCKLRIGHLYRFGTEHNYLMILNLPELFTDEVNKLFYNEFPHILSLNLIITENYRLFSKYRDKLTDLENQLETIILELPELKREEDPIKLEIRKDHVAEMALETQKIKIEFQTSVQNLALNLSKIKKVVHSLDLIQDKIFTLDLQQFEQYSNTVQTWIETNENIFDNISEKANGYSLEVTFLIDKLESNAIKENTIPKPYTTPETSSRQFTMDNKPYQKASDEFISIGNIDTDILDSIPMAWCISYVLLEPEASRSMKIFCELISNKFKGICITDKDRGTIAEKFDINESIVYTITPEEGENHVPPILSKISHLINDFLSENYHGIIYLDGIESLIKYNDFERVLKFINNIKDSITLNDFILIYPLNNTFLGDGDLSLLLENTINISNLNVEFEDLI